MYSLSLVLCAEEMTSFRIRTLRHGAALIEYPVLKLNLGAEGVLPFIPKVLEILGLPSLKGKLELSSGINLAAWDKVSKRFKSKN
jgi:hypothetical protein